MRICFYTKRLTQRLDEGMARVAHEVVSRLERQQQVLTLFSMGDAVEKENLVKVTTNRTGLDLALRAEIKRFQPDLILFLCRGPVGLASLSFARVLKWHGGCAEVVILSPQTRRGASSLLTKLECLLKPDLVLVTSGKDQRALVNLRFAADFVPLGVDLERFAPVTDYKKKRLRRKYGFDEDEFVVLHVGHITEGRNLRALGAIQGKANCVVIAGSTFASHDGRLVDDLKAQRIRLLAGYNDQIQDLYQLADLYVFPTVDENACISQPLSVLEAMACNLPVVSTRFGGLPDLFPIEGDGLFYVDGPSQIAARAQYVCDNVDRIRSRTREMVEPYSWEMSSRRILQLLEECRAVSDVGITI